jgi:eukaryotic-like serine/threonine-protein kinase
VSLPPPATDAQATTAPYAAPTRDADGRRPPDGAPGDAAPDATATSRAAPSPVPRSARPGTALVWRLFVATGAAVGAVIAIVLAALAASAGRAADAALARGLADVRGHVSALLEGRSRALTSAALVFAQTPSFRTLVADRQPVADLLDQAVEAAQRAGASWTQITDADGVRMAKSDEPGAPQVTLAGTALVGRALAGEPAAGAGVAGDSAIIQAVAVPVTLGAQIVGVLMAARTLDDAAAREIRGETASEVLVYLIDGEGRPRVAAATVPAADRPALLDAVRARRAADPRHPPTDAPVTARLAGAAYVGQELPLRSATGEVVGGVVTLRSRDRELAPFVALRREIALGGAAGLALALALAFAVARQVTRPLAALADAARRAAAGDWTAAPPSVATSGEVSELADAMRSMLSGMQERRALAALVERARSAPPPEGERDSPPPVPSAALRPGASLGRRYLLEAVLGVGGNGVVYRAADRELGETVAIKTLRPELVLGGPEALDRLKEEIRIARRISHPGVVRIHDIGEDTGIYFITMEHVPGISLADVLRRLGRLPAAQAVAVGRQLSAALGAAHARGVIHRDVKPQNLMLQPDGALKVLDFGVARLAQRTAGLTAVGLVVGTPEYMAPEQLLDEPVDARADVYAAGVVLYEALVGRRPVEAASPAATIARLLAESPVPPHELRADVPPAVSAVVMRALARDPGQRPADGAALEALLARVAGA